MLTRSIFLKIFKTSLRILILFILFIGAYFICYLIGSNYTVNNQEEKDTTVEIFISSNGVHTDLIFPVKHEAIHWDSLFPPQTFKSVDTNFRYIAMGWGDKGFYIETPTWADLKASTAFKAMFFLGTSAMHISYHKTIVPSENTRSIKISMKQYAKLINYYRNTFGFKANRPEIITGKGYTDFDNFYEAKGKYSCFTTCNVYTNSALKEAGIKAPIWSPLAEGLIKHY